MFERWPPAARLGLLVTVLVVENLWFFHAHYLGTAAFPYDFSQTYHAVPFFWQTAAHAGHVPQWIPYQAFGYPLALNLQSGLFYPPLWVFPISGLTYSLRAAAILQGLHVLAGGFGAYAFTRARGLSFAVALVAAVAYSAFGGFFCNAQHVDIVRGYALLPFLFAALTLGGRWRCVAVVPVVYLLVTGAYPGMWLAACAFGGGYLALQIIERREMAGWREVAGRCAAIALGLAAAAVNVVPGFALRGELSRVDEVGKLSLTGLGVDHWFTTLLPDDSSRLSGDLSMRSLFVGAPILLGLCLLRREDVRRHVSLIALAIAALVMAKAGIVFALVVKLVPPLGYSRFPAADYRGLIALPLVVLGAAGLVQLFEQPDRSWRRIAGGFAVLIAFVVAGVCRLAPPHVLGLALVLVGLAILVLIRTRVPGTLLVTASIVLALGDAHIVHHAVEASWIGAPEHIAFKRFGHELAAELAHERTERPARARARFQLDGLAPDLEGYLRGHYTNDDYAASEHLWVVQDLRASPVLADYLVAASSPHLLDPVAAYTGPSLAATAASGGVVTTEFSPDRISYSVTATSDKILVENEPVFAGWTSTLDCDRARPALAVRELWPLRAWRIPAGTQRICVTYTTPDRTLARAVSLASLALWLAWVGLVAWRRRSRHG